MCSSSGIRPWGKNQRTAATSDNMGKSIQAKTASSVHKTELRYESVWMKVHTLQNQTRYHSRIQTCSGPTDKAGKDNSQEGRSGQTMVGGALGAAEMTGLTAKTCQIWTLNTAVSTCQMDPTGSPHDVTAVCPSHWRSLGHVAPPEPPRQSACDVFCCFCGMESLLHGGGAFRHRERVFSYGSA